MKISELISEKEQVFSFEFFPPKTPKGEEQLIFAINQLKPLAPDFVSVTYGAMGSNQEKTLAIVKKIKHEIGLEVMSHFTCISLTEEKVDDYLEQLKKEKIENILALRGDIPKEMPRELALQGAYQYANQLVASIRQKTKNYFSVAVAGYPEGHNEAISIEKDIENLKQKVDAGADFIITQLFYDNEDFYRFRDLAVARGITIPIIPGVMPIETAKQLQVITAMCGAKIPEHLEEKFQVTDATPEEQAEWGIRYAIDQCQDLLDNQAKGIHFYTLNKSSATKQIFQSLRKVT